MDIPKDQTSMLLGLLDRNLKTRLGASKHGHGFKTDVVTHPFLKHINWAQIDSKTYPTKFEPQFSASKVKESTADLKKGSVLSFESSKQYHMHSQSKASVLSDLSTPLNLSMSGMESRENIESTILATCFHPYNALEAINEPVEMPVYFLRPKSATPAERPLEIRTEKSVERTVERPSERGQPAIVNIRHP